MQSQVFASSYLPLTKHWASRHQEELRNLLAHLPPDWSIEDRLVARFYPELRASAYAYFYATGPNISGLFSSAVLARMDAELVEMARDALNEMFRRGTARSLASVAAIVDKSDGLADADVAVRLSRGVALVELSARCNRWSRERQHNVGILCTILFARQHDFLSRGTARLRPLSRRTLADAASLNEATVSRNLAGVRVATPHGTFGIDEMFSTSLPAHRAHPVAAKAVKAVLGELLRDPAVALMNDAELVERLRQDGFRVARRTVAKYRADLGVPKASRRKPDGAAGRSE